LLELETSTEGIHVALAIDQYVHYRVTMGALGDELVQALMDSQFRPDEVVARAETALPWRRRLLPNAAAVADYGARMCAGGVHVTFAIQRPAPDDDFVIPLQKRSHLLSEGQAMMAVLPTAMHQPSISAAAGKPFHHTVFRELYEEVFGGDEVDDDAQHLAEDWYTAASVCEPLAWMTEHPECFRMVLLGWGLNLLTGNYELAVLLVIRDPVFWEKYGHLLVTNWETAGSNSPLVSSKQTLDLKNLLENPAWTGGGIFSFASSLSYLERTEPTRVRVPALSLYAR
jgi:hypothetical protein